MRTICFKQVVARLLSFPSDFWDGVLAVEKNAVVPPVVESNVANVCPSTSKDKLFKPLTSPEMSKYSRSTSGGSVKGRIKHFVGTSNNTKPRNEPGKKKFFTSPK
ncbi:hypothetical protein DNTS_002682 [Danionella cerebrum]|uniref:Uncharacterized protein n=1 Tax=Danionella cerebrum TaxID=2873325 RepID=A0A553QJ24_9TELE|nr:hypothetical protein DNTS_002682 [Danionella translucida]